MAAAPYTAAELAGLRAAAEHTDPGGMTRRLLATLAAVEADRDALRKELATARAQLDQAQRDLAESHANCRTLAVLLDQTRKELAEARIVRSMVAKATERETLLAAAQFLAVRAQRAKDEARRTSSESHAAVMLEIARLADEASEVCLGESKCLPEAAKGGH